jgi:hypothetical protein
MVSSENKQAELKCIVSIDTMSAEIRNLFNADSVTIYSKKIKEEVYFNEINCPVVLIYNATTNILNFKTLPTSHYQRFENFEQIENDLKNEGIVIARSIIDKCNMTEFNDLIIEFLKLDDDGKPLYRFICHYKDLLK